MCKPVVFCLIGIQSSAIVHIFFNFMKRLSCGIGNYSRNVLLVNSQALQVFFYLFIIK